MTVPRTPYISALLLNSGALMLFRQNLKLTMVLCEINVDIFLHVDSNKVPKAFLFFRGQKRDGLKWVTQRTYLCGLILLVRFRNHHSRLRGACNDSTTYSQYGRSAFKQRGACIILKLRDVALSKDTVLQNLNTN